MSVLCYNGSKECNLCMRCEEEEYSDDVLDENGDIDWLFDLKRDKELCFGDYNDEFHYKKNTKEMSNG